MASFTLPPPHAFDPSFRDPYLFLARVKAHLADHKPMDDGDCLAWHVCDVAQKRILQDGRL